MEKTTRLKILDLFDQLPEDVRFIFSGLNERRTIRELAREMGISIDKAERIRLGRSLCVR